MVVKFRLSIMFIKIYNWYLGLFGSSVDEKFDQAMLKKQEDMFAEYGFKAMDNMYDAWSLYIVSRDCNILE